MLLIGSHVSFDKKEQLLKSAKEAISYGANTFMFYTGAPQNTNRSKIDPDITKEAIELMKKNDIDFSKVIVHAPYIINLANKTNLDFGVSFLTEELNRCSELGVNYLVLHPGSHVGQGVEVGLNNIIEGLNQVFLNYHGNVQILLETMAGKGSELGVSFNQLKTIIDGVTNPDMLGVCLDTCHLHDSGYDLKKFDSILEEFDEIIGLDKLKCIHINDSKNPSSSHKDRHENFGFGYLGFDNLINIIYNPRLESIPKILATPWVEQKPPYKYEIEMIRNKKFDPELKSKIIG